ncbi:MAG: CcoQ/FixQ family Cbb3-type cytochrome c oxidase assembly chaperone [Bacteroidetes bacterium]|jgi:fructose-specific phosphotransferase system IIC component|nr:MAG: CcoQ/FixQ family Cbb3-type cytochrome c oxidase assembly chaperone [Bacteroidota bacterium]
MLKYVKHHLENIVGVEIYPIISFLIFFLFFIAVLIWLIRVDKQHINKLKNIPFE